MLGTRSGPMTTCTSPQYPRVKYESTARRKRFPSGVANSKAKLESWVGTKARVLFWPGARSPKSIRVGSTSATSSEKG